MGYARACTFAHTPTFTDTGQLEGVGGDGSGGWAFSTTDKTEERSTGALAGKADCKFEYSVSVSAMLMKRQCQHQPFDLN